MSSRPYRIVSGVSYPRLYVGANQPRTINTEIDAESREYYHDESVKLNGEDVKGFVGKPICLEHDPDVRVGQITAAWQDRENHMRITARIFTDTPEGLETFERINNGDLRGFSVGYDVKCHNDRPNEIIGKHFNEVSVCQEPFFQGAGITVAASNQSAKKDYKSGDGNRVLNFKIMAEQKNTDEEQQQKVPLDQTNKDSSEIARVHDEVLRANEAMKAKLEALEKAQVEKDAQLERFQQEKQAQRAEYAEKNKKVLDEVLEINREQIREEQGPEADLHEDYVTSTTAAFMAPEAANVIAPIVASARRWKAARDLAKTQEAKYNELHEKMKKMSDDNSIAEAHVRASARRLNMATDQQEQQQDTTDERRLAVTASSMDITKLFVPQQPNQQERDLARMNYGQELPSNTVNVSASSAKQELAPIPVLANKNLEASVPNSMRYSQNGKYLFHHLVCNARGFSAAPVMDIKKETETMNY